MPDGPGHPPKIGPSGFAAVDDITEVPRGIARAA